jgi:hypothetical protein
MEADSGRDSADIELPVLRLLEIEEGFISCLGHRNA